MSTILNFSLFDSLHSLDDSAFIRKAYATMLGRPADPSGFSEYLAHLRSGMSREAVLTELASSDEGRRFAERRGGPVVQPAVVQPTVAGSAHVLSVQDLLELDGVEFVQQAYLVLLGRPADASGLKDYASRLISGTSKLQLIVDIHSDPEGMAFGARLAGLKDAVRDVRALEDGVPQVTNLEELMNLHGDNFIKLAYRMILQRDASEEGLATYSRQLSIGMPRIHVLRELSQSPEGREKNSNIAGLQCAIRRYKKANRRNWGGWYYRQVLDVESDLPAERQIRALSYVLRSTSKPNK